MSSKKPVSYFDWQLQFRRKHLKIKEKNCPKTYQTCENFIKNTKPDSHCQKNSTIGYCIKQLEQWNKEIDDYFQEYNNSKIIK